MFFGLTGAVAEEQWVFSLSAPPWPGGLPATWIYTHLKLCFCSLRPPPPNPLSRPHPPFIFIPVLLQLLVLGMLVVCVCVCVSRGCVVQLYFIAFRIMWFLAADRMPSHCANWIFWFRGLNPPLLPIYFWTGWLLEYTCKFDVQGVISIKLCGGVSSG